MALNSVRTEDSGLYIQKKKCTLEMTEKAGVGEQVTGRNGYDSRRIDRNARNAGGNPAV